MNSLTPRKTGRSVGRAPCGWDGEAHLLLSTGEWSPLGPKLPKPSTFPGGLSWDHRAWVQRVAAKPPLPPSAVRPTCQGLKGWVWGRRLQTPWLRRRRGRGRQAEG